MTPRPRSAWLWAALALAAGTANAAPAAPEPSIRWVSVSLLGGTAQPVSRLADYQWDVHPHAGWGAQALVGLGGWSVGPRFWRSGTTQALGISGTPDPRVHSTSYELVARTRVARWRTVECVALASGGRLAIRYQPDRLTLDAGGSPIELALGPMDAWIVGAGLALHAPVAGGWTVGMETERRVYALDTAHRSGAGVTYAHETFGDWHMRFELGRAWGW